jgi:hypothetical protein
MRRSLRDLAVVIGSTALLAGCGPSGTELRERTLSTLNTVADTWDGGAGFQSTAADAYGKPLIVTVSKGPLNYGLEVRSCGPDGLPKNSDDVVVHRHKRHGETTVNKEVEKASESVVRGGIRGVIQGTKEALTGKPNKGNDAVEKD